MASKSGEGRRRLTLLLCGTSGGLCALLMLVVLVLNGPPFRGLWWGVMAAVLVAACTLPSLLVPAIEWVLDGYRQDR